MPSLELRPGALTAGRRASGAGAEGRAIGGAATVQPGTPRRSHLAPRLAPWLFISPSLVLFAVFAFAPIVVAFVLSFQDVQVFGGGTWVGAANYQTMVSNDLFWTSVRNTVVFTVGTVPTSAGLGLLLAVLLNRRLPGRGFLRSLYFLPMVVSGVAVSLVMAWIFNEDNGIVNSLLTSTGMPRIGWLSSPNWAMFTVVLTIVWGRIGFCMVTYLAALQGISGTLMEAAEIDGAGAWRRFRSISWPLLAPTTYMLIVLNIVFSIQAFDVIYVLTGGGPGFATTVLVQYIFRTAFSDGKMGYASAVGVVLVVVLLLLTLLRGRLARRTEDLA